MFFGLQYKKHYLFNIPQVFGLSSLIRGVILGEGPYWSTKLLLIVGFLFSGVFVKNTLPQLMQGFPAKGFANFWLFRIAFSG